MKFIDNFRDIGNRHIGFLGIRQHYYAGDKQLHTIKGGITSVVYFMMHKGFGVSNGMAILLSLIIVVALAYAWEHFRKGKVNHYDVISDVIGWFIIVIIGGQLISQL